MRKILIVDDDEGILEALADFLSAPSVAVIKCGEITQAEYAVKNSFFDAVIADIRLTGVLGREGLELLPYIREKSPRTEVIIMTAYGGPEIEQEAYEKGAYYYFDKPIDLNILKDKLKELGIYG
jgi:two-component system, NtrC family, response regulator AtoC